MTPHLQHLIEQVQRSATGIGEEGLPGDARAQGQFAEEDERLVAADVGKFLFGPRACGVGCGRFGGDEVRMQQRGNHDAGHTERHSPSTLICMRMTCSRATIAVSATVRPWAGVAAVTGTTQAASHTHAPP